MCPGLRAGWHRGGRESPGVPAGMNAVLAASPDSSRLRPRARRGPRQTRAPRAGCAASIPRPASRASSRNHRITE